MRILRSLRSKLKARRDRWESLCRKCGVCCYAKEGGVLHTVIHMNKPCEYFDKRTKLCKIYEERFRICRYCGKVRLYHALFSRCLPDTCGYVEHYRRWRLVRGAEIKR